MATLHQATLTPTKLELLTAWLPGRHWYPDEAVDGLQRVAGCRFDDPEGEVGIELLVVRAGEDGPLVHVPMTYRGAPLEEADFYLIGTMQHSVLGSRWVYDAVGDPVFIEALTATIRAGGQQAEEVLETPDGPQRREPSLTVWGTGTAEKPEPAGRLVRVEDGDPAVVVAEAARLDVRRVLNPVPAEGPLALVGAWAGQTPTVLADLY